MMKTVFWHKRSALIRNILLLIADLCALSASVFAALMIYRFFGGRYNSMEMALQFWPFVVSFVLVALFGKLYGMNFFYGGACINPQEELRRITLTSVAGALVLFTALALEHNVESISRGAMIICTVLTIFAVPAFRYVMRVFMKKSRIGVVPVVVAGCGKIGQAVIEELLRDKFYGFVPVGYFDDEDLEYRRIPRLGRISEVVKVSRAMEVSTLISCVPVYTLQRHRIRWKWSFEHLIIIAANSSFSISWTYPVDLNGLPAFGIHNKLRYRALQIWKNTVEIVFSAVAVALLFIPGIVIALLIKLTSAGPVFYMAKRLGRNGKPFYCIKFRTMYKDAHARLKELLDSDPLLALEWERNFKLDKDPRITPLGRFLRKTSLDELPQFINVIKGDMALIGPRPIVAEEKKYFGKNYRLISRMKPGVTGLWQVSGRSNTNYDRRVFLNMYYLKNWSIWLDYYIFLKTIIEVAFCRGAK